VCLCKHALYLATPEHQRVIGADMAVGSDGHVYYKDYRMYNSQAVFIDAVLSTPVSQRHANVILTANHHVQWYMDCEFPDPRPGDSDPNYQRTLCSTTVRFFCRVFEDVYKRAMDPDNHWAFQACMRSKLSFHLHSGIRDDVVWLFSEFCWFMKEVRHSK
jgi:hypothetical protein